MIRISSLFIVSLLVFSIPARAVDTADTGYLDRHELRDFIDSMVTKHDFNRVDLVNLFSHVRQQKSILDAISSPAEAKPWHQYRNIFVNDSRIDGGVKFWNEHEALLERAQETYGVPAEIIVAIIGVETRYGQHKGRYPVLDALSTLAFDYPKRAAFFLSELEQFLVLAREENWEFAQVQGSYAGAMGIPQFISSSYRHYAVDFDDDGKRDLIGNVADAIGSVANYFQVHGWMTGHPVAVRAKVDGEKYQNLLTLGLKPHTPVERIKAYGVSPAWEPEQRELASLIELEMENGHEYWLGFNNFYVITRYNRSPLYAMAVFQLSKAIADRKKASMSQQASDAQ